MSIKENFTNFWDRVSGKTLDNLARTVSGLEEKLNMMQLDLDAANIKLASTEIDLEASNIEKETLKIELEEKRAELAKLKLTIDTMQKEASSSEELEALVRKAKMEEYLKDEYKKRIGQLVDMLTVMSQDPKYNDIIKIQTNSIDEFGKEMRQVYLCYNNEVTIQVDEEVKEPEMKSVKEDSIDEALEKLIPDMALLDSNAVNELYDELMELAN